MSCTPVIGAEASEPQSPSAAQLSQVPCEHTALSFQCVEYLRNYDGDTLTVAIPNVHPLLGNEITVRIRGIDTPEIKGRMPCEKDAARLAQTYVADELRNARRIDLVNIGRDKYFRILADVVYDGKALAEQMIRLGLGRPYDGGAKTPREWCATRSSTPAMPQVPKE